MLGRITFLVVLTGGLAAVAFGASRLYVENRDDGDDAAPEATATVQEIGAPLYSPQAKSPKAALPRRGAVDPLVVGDCRLVVFEKEEVPAQHDGVVLFIGTEVGDGEVVPADRLVKTPDDKSKRYRRLREGDMVRAGQLLARLDDRIARAEVSIKRGKQAAARAELAAAEKARDEARTRYDNGLRLHTKDRKAISSEDLGERKLMFDKLTFEAIAKKEAVELARLEVEQVQAALEMYEIRSSIDGVIKTIYKNPGEAVKSAPSYEPVFQILNLNRLRVEGLVDEHHLSKLHVGESVSVEAAAAQAPEQVFVGHLQEVTGVAVSCDAKSVLSASLDGTVRVWDRSERLERHILRHRGAVTAIAASPVGNACVTACQDGTLHYWELNAATPKARDFADHHSGAVHCLAFSPDGACCASGGDDRSIAVWETKTGKLRYRLNSHSGAVTAVWFTPEARLVSASRDNTLRTWELGQDDARTLTVLPRRSGDVARPGVSPDGRLVAFDPWQEKSLRLLSIPEGRTEAVLIPASGATRPTTFALFATDGKSLVTAGGAEGRLHLWELNAARAHVERTLVPEPRATPTCAAFAPNGSFLVAGTRERHVLLWARNGSDKPLPALNAKITNVERAVDSQQVRVWAELDNTDGRLLPGATVTMVRYPK